MSRREIRTLLVAFALATASSACSNRAIGLELRERGRFASEWSRYLELRPHKSLAFAGEVEGRYVIGYGFDEVTADAAAYAALRDCEIRRVDKRIESPCRTVATDDDFVDEDGDLLGSIDAQ